MKKSLLLFIFVLALTLPSKAETLYIVDPCFSSVGVGTGGFRSGNLITLGGDVLEWAGSHWSGGHAKANLDMQPIMPAFCNDGLKAIWLGSGPGWNFNGEGVSFLLNKAMEQGKTYTIHFVYASHGTGSDGQFAPHVATSFTGDNVGIPIGRLRPANNSWRADSITFTANHDQHGSQWITLHTRTDASSGLILSRCPQPEFDILPDVKFCAGQEVKLRASFLLKNYTWSDGSSGEEIVVTEDGVIWLESESPCGTLRDTLDIKFEDCGPGVGTPNGNGKLKGKKIKMKIEINFSNCWFGSCDDDLEPTGPPSPDIIVYNVVSPNGDGLNELFVVENVEDGSWVVRVFNRHGSMVFEDIEYKNTWSPTELVPGVYYVVIKDRNSTKKYTGTLTVVY